MSAYYNEHDRFAAAWLRELIKAGHIAPGEVDERDIRDVLPSELAGFTQCHFFAGIGVWSYALRCAGWPDDRPVWTGSCPCQPFSAAGKSGGFDDERHLWPDWFWLIEQFRPPTIFGEQVASKDGLAWLDLVSADLEGKAYAIGALDTCAAGFGAPHIRQRLYWVADAEGRRQRKLGDALVARESGHADGSIEPNGVVNANDARSQGRRLGRDGADQRPLGPAGVAGEFEQPGGIGWQRRETAAPRHDDDRQTPERSKDQYGPRVTSSHWRNSEWIACRDGKSRPVESGTFPLAHGAPVRVGRLRGYGNAIVAPQAAEFIKAYLLKSWKA